MLRRLATDPEKVVDDGLAALAANQAVKVSGFNNAMMAGSVRFMPRGMIRRMVAGIQKGR